MKILEIHLEVEDLERSFNLYSKLIPHKRVEYWEDKSAVAFVLENGTAFGLWKKGKRGIHNGQGGRNVHYAFQIESNELEQYKELLISLGLEPLEHDWNDGRKSIYFFDPDGHQGEFMTGDWL